MPYRSLLATALIASHFFCSSVLAEAELEERKYVKVCPSGQTTSCREIGYSDPTPPAIESNVVIPVKYIPGPGDYTFSEIGPTITAPPPTSATGSMTYYTSYSQISTSKNLVVIPVIVPIPVGEPIPPEIPEGDVPETLDLPEGSDLPESELPTTSDTPTTSTDSPSSSLTSSSPPSSSSGSSSSSEAGGSCTKPTPAPQSPAVSPVKQTGVTAVDSTDSGTGTGTPAPTSTPSSSGACPASSPTSPIPGCWGQPGCAYVIASDLGPGAACSADYCNCGGTNVPLLTSTVSGSTSLGCGYTTQPASNNCPAGPTSAKSSSASASSAKGGFTFNPKQLPTVTGSACFAPASATPSGQKEIHPSRISAAFSSGCSQMATSISAGLARETPWFFETFFDQPDGGQIDLSTDINLFATSNNGPNINFPDDCITGFNNAVNNCPTNSGGTWGGAVSFNSVEYSIYGTDASTSSKKKRTIAIGPQQIQLPQRPARETHLYAYAECPEAHGCDTGYAIADHYSFSPSSICDKDSNEISFHSIDKRGSDMRFKSFGHEGCSLDPNLDDESEEGPYARLDCGGNFRGVCEPPSSEDVEPRLCVEDSKERTAVKNGTVFQKMAVCRF